MMLQLQYFIYFFEQLLEMEEDEWTEKHSLIILSMYITGSFLISHHPELIK